MQLVRHGFLSIQIYEKNSQLGGTWAENSYPNAGCDIPSFLYSFSFEPKHDWSQKYGRQPEILKYFETCADKYNLHQKIRFNTSVESARFKPSSKTWVVTDSNGDTREYDYFVSAVGQLNRPSIPIVEGLDEFQGRSFHSAQWDHSFDPTNKDIVCVGAGASAIQFIPGLAKKARMLTILQRSPNWIAPLNDFRYPQWVASTFRKIPFLAKLYRLWIFLTCESRFVAFRKDSIASFAYSCWAKLRLRWLLASSEQENLVPDYPAGCKRILLSSEFYETIEQDNVNLITDSIKRIAPNGVKAGNQTINADAIIFATGFQTSSLLTPMEVVGRDETRLADEWSSNPGAYLGMMVPKFPNFFVLYGPNTNLGHNSIIFMVECQTNYILKCLKLTQDQGISCLEPKSEPTQEYRNMVQKRLKRTVWDANCQSWYKTSDGVMINNWCGSAVEYWWKTRKPRVSDLHAKQEE